MNSSAIDEARPTPESGLDADVVVVGYGPVGQSLALLLGRSGHRVVVCERRTGRYETPRAGHFDHEIMRVFQGMGVAAEVQAVVDPAVLYEFHDPDGNVVAQLPRSWPAPSGWEASYHFYQPELEAVLDDAVQATPSVQVRYGTTVVGVRTNGGHEVVTLLDGRTITAKYVVGADGANSVVRSLCDMPTQDLGFRGDWLVIDVRPRPGAVMPTIPDTGQVLDPARPNHMGRVAQRWFRWEFMLVDGDDPAQMVTPDRAWELLSPWVGPHQAELIRQTVYQFRSVVADSFRDGSVLLAGDAAHVMPPFLGQGMGSGIRDAATLSWLLDLVLRGADDRLLDLYTASRRPNVLAYIQESMRIGTVVCETDPAASAERIDQLRSATELPPPFQPAVGAGFVPGSPLSGHLGVQPQVLTENGQAHLSDDVLGGGFTLLSLRPTRAEANDVVAGLKTSIGLRTLVVGDEGLSEVGSALEDWMRAAGVVAVVVRPDFYVYGAVSTMDELPALLDHLRSSLHLR